MKMAFRWFGKSDPVTLEKIAQIPGMRSVVSAVYDGKPGQIWDKESLENIRRECEKYGLIFDVVESVPVHENIKLGASDSEKLTDIYCENIKRCAGVGIKCVTYNFMPVFDWTRTQLDKKAADGSTSLVMYADQLKNMNPLIDDVDLPGWDSSYSRDEIRELIEQYGKLGEEGLWSNLEKFLKRIIPVAQSCGVKMAIHPDDPPYPIFGLPRIIADERALDRVLSIVDSPSNCLCLCTGSLGCVKSNDVIKMIEKFAARGKIAFAHLRNVGIVGDGSFEERAHLSSCGSLDMYGVVKALVKAGYDGYVRPDHGRMIWGERGKPGYGLFDRALGATYINGLFEALEKEYENDK
ncbi:MAG: mannonate dehydratase [Christensenellales bacterium]